MAESYRGLTIRIGGDTSKLTKALRNTNGAITQTQQELRKVGQALKLDPGNIEAFNQQMGYMASQATNTASKLAMLKHTQEQMRDTHITLSTGETGTVESFARATAEFGGEVENVAGRLATAQTRFNQLTSTLATMHNEVTDLAKDMAKVRQQRIVDAFDLASGKKSVDDIRDAFSTLPDGTERAKDAVDEYVKSVERIAEVSKRVATSSGTEQNKAATELRKLLRNDPENPDGSSMSASAIKGLVDTIKQYGAEHQKVVAEVAKGNGEMESSQKETEDRLIAQHREYVQQRIAAYEAAMAANKRQVEEEKTEREQLYKDANARLKELSAAEEERKRQSGAEIAGYDEQIAAIDRQLEELGKVVVTEESLREKIEQVTAAREEQKAWYTEAKANIDKQIREWEELRKERERALQENDDPAIDKSVIRDLQNAVSECDEEIERLNSDRQKLISENRSDVAKLAGEARKLSNDLAKIQDVGEVEFNEKYRRRSAEEIDLGKQKANVERQRAAAIDESTKAQERFNKEYEAASTFKTPELEDLGERVGKRQEDVNAMRASLYADIADSMTRTDREIQKSSDTTSGAVERNSAQVQKSLDSMFREMSKYGRGMDGFSSLVFNNKNGNTDIKTMGPIIDEMTKKLGLSEYAAQNFKAAIADISDEFKGANKDVQQLEQIAKYQDLVSEIMKSEAAVKQLSRAMSDMHMPSDLMRGMYTLNANVKELEASYKALSATGSGLSSIFKSDPTNMEAASQAMNAFSAAEIVANETADRMRQRLEKFDTGAIDRATDSTKSATQQLFDASLAAEQARDSYHTLAGEVQFLEGVQSQLMGKQPVTLSTDPEEADAIRESYGKAVEELDECNAALATLRERAARARSAMESAVEAEEMAKTRKEYEELSSGATMYASNARKAAEAAREIFVQRSVAETFGDTGVIDRLQERISSLTSSANAFESAFEFDPKNVDMATTSMARLQEAEELAAQRIAELSRATSGFDTSKIDELRDKYGSVTAAVNTLRDAQGEAINKMRDAIANRLSEIDNGYESSMLRAMSEKLMDPNAKFEGFQLDFLPEPIRKAREEMDKFSTTSKESLRDLADAEKALKFEQMQQEIATARMELEKLMRQEYDIVLRLSLQGEFGDTTKITEALDGAMQSAMGRVGTFDEALKFDTKNVDLLDSRMRAVTDAMNLGTREAASLSAAMSKIDVSAVEEMRSTYGSVSNAVNMTTDKVNDLISKVAEQRAKMEAADEGSDAYVEAKANVEALEAELEEAQQASAKAAQYEQWERYDEQLAKVRTSMERLKSDVREVAERNVEAFSANYSEGMFGDVDEQVASFDAAISKAEERYKKYTDALSKEPHDKLFKAEQTKALEEAVDLTTKKVAFLKQTMSQFDESKVAALKERYGSFGRAVDDSKLKLKATEAEIESLKQKVNEFAAKNGKSAEWIRQFTDAKAEIGTVPPELEKVRARLVELWDVQGEQQLELAIASVSSRLEELGDDANTAMAALRKTLEGEGTSFMDSAAFTQATQEMGQWARQAGQHIVDSANTIDSAYRDMRKTVEGTEEDFERIRQAAIEFSQTHAISADQMLEMEALGGQLGVLSHNLEQFGTLASNLSIATDIETDDVALQLGQMQNIMSDLDSMDKLDSFGDALVRLGNNAAAQESAIMNVAQRIAAVANVTSMTSPQVLGWSAAIAETGQRSESAATALVRTITGIGDAVNKGGSTLENFAAIADMSADDFKAAWENSSSEALEAFVEGLETLTDDSTAAIQALDDVGISSVRQETALLALSQTVDNLEDNITMSKDAFEGVSDQWGDAGDAAREAQNKSEGFSGSLAILQNNADNLAASLGDGLKPFLDVLSGALRTLTDLVNGMSPTMKSAVVSVGGLALVLGTVVPIVNQFRKGWVEMAEAMRRHATISQAMSKGMSEDTASTAANTESKGANTTATDANATASETAGAAKQAEASATGENTAAMASDTASTEANTAATERNAAASEAAAAAKRSQGDATVEAMADMADSVDDVTDAVDDVTDAADAVGDVADAATDAADAMGDMAKGASEAGDAVVDAAKGADAVGDVADAATDAAGAMAGAKAASDAVADAVGEVAVAEGAAAGAAGDAAVQLGFLSGTVAPIAAVVAKVMELAQALSEIGGLVGDVMLAAKSKGGMVSARDTLPDASAIDETKAAFADMRAGFVESLNTLKSFGETARTTFDGVSADSAVVEQYGKKIEELASQSQLTSAEQKTLEQMVTAFNDKTGAGIEIVDAATGKLNVMAGQVRDLTDAYRVQAEQRAYESLYEEAVKKQAEAQLQYDRAMQQVNETLGESKNGLDLLTDSGVSGFDLLTNGAKVFQTEIDMIGTGATMQGAKDALDEAKTTVEMLEDKMGSATFQYGSFENAMTSAGIAAEQYSSLTEEQRQKLVDIQTALIRAGHSLGEYKNLTAEQLVQIVAAWKGSVPDIIKAIETIQASTKTAGDASGPTVDYTKQAKARKKVLDREYNDKKKEYDAEYKLQQKELDRQYKAASKASQKYLKEFKKRQKEEVEAFKEATDAKVKEIEREYEAKQKLLDQEYEGYDSEIDEKIKGIEAEQDAEDEARKQRDRQEKLDELNEKVNEARQKEANARTRKSAEEAAEAREDAEKSLNDYLDDLRAEDTKSQRDAQIQRLKDQKSALKEQYDERKKELKESYDLAVSNYKAQREAELKILQEKQEAEYEMVSEAEQAKLEALKESHQNQLEDLKNFHDSQLQILKDANEAEVEAIKAGNAAKEQAAAEHAENMEQIAEDAATKTYQTVDGTMTGMPTKMAEKMGAGLGMMQVLAAGATGPIGAAMSAVVGSALDPAATMPALMSRYGADGANALVTGFSGETATQAMQYMAQRLVDAGTDPLEVLPIVSGQLGAQSAWAVANGLSDDEAEQRACEATQAIVDANGDIMRVMAVLNEAYGRDAAVAAANGLSTEEALSNVKAASEAIMSSALDPFTKMGMLARLHMSNAAIEAANGLAEKGDLSAENAAEIAKNAAESMNSYKEWSRTSGQNLAINFANGMASGDAISATTNAAFNLAAIAASYLHHSTPDRGPLRDDDEWGGELVENWVASMRSRFGLLSGATGQMAGVIFEGMSLGDVNADFMQSLVDDMRSKEGELLRQARRMSDIVERGFDPRLTVDAAYEAVGRIDRGRLRRQQMVASRQSVDNSTYAPVININIPEMVVREEADIDRISNRIAVKVQRQLN